MTGDFVAIWKLIYKIGTAVRKNSKAAPSYQQLVVELESFNRSLEALQSLKLAEYELKRVDAVRGLVLTCQRPLEELLTKTEAFEMIW